MSYIQKTVKEIGREPITLNAETAARYRYLGYNCYFDCSKCENCRSDSDDNKCWQFSPVEDATTQGNRSKMYCAKYHREVKR